MTAVACKSAGRRPSHRRLLSGAITALAIFAASGCTQDSSDLEAYIADVKRRPSAPIEPIPEMKVFETFSYPETPQRDPFSAPLQAKPVAESQDGPRPDPGRPREPLEDFPLDSLAMAGLLEQKGELWALVKDPGGVVHRIQPGNYLGQNHGRVTAISEQEVQVTELVSNGTGGWIERRAALAVKE